MTSQLNVDTIVDKAGSGGTNVKVANTSTYVSDGGNVTQNTVQASAKVWCNYDGTGTVQIDDSLNTASITDSATGTQTITFTNSMANTQTARPTGSGSPSGQTIGIRQSDTFNASNFTAETYYGTNTIADFASVSFEVLGDLA